jgi:hypothetical protein
MHVHLLGVAVFEWTDNAIHKAVASSTWRRRLSLHPADAYEAEHLLQDAFAITSELLLPKVDKSKL